MADPHWDDGVDVDVPAKPDHGYWTKAIDYIDGPKRLKFVVEDMRQSPAQQQSPPAANVKNEWKYSNERHCTADGDPRAPVNPANCLLQQAPPGALIAKIGGSTAGRSEETAKLFVVGSFCIYDLDPNTKGTLYLTMNTDPMSSLERSGNLSVKIYRSV